MTPKDTVFVVDDDPAARESLAALVETMGLECETFSSAEQFLEVCNSDRPGCLVADIFMSGMNGLELQKVLADKDITLPVIIISAYANVPLTTRAMKGGAVTLLEKPCSGLELCENIRAALLRDRQNRRQTKRRQKLRRLIVGADEENQWPVIPTTAKKAS